ncbi:MAG: class I SAM-dependent methyltransferase [candidate division WOR-3 bacterium]|nr:class I SAM-dependent methyltransferase [candidate division WOR-3 bacterium]
MRDKRILEVGAGTGRDGLRMRELGADVYLLDYSKESLRIIRLLSTNDPVKMILGDARNCPFEDGTFDVVFHQGLLEHFPSPWHLLNENARILKRGGLLIIDVPQTFHFYTLMKHLLMILGLWFGGWERQFTPGSLAGMLKRLGFAPVHVYGDWSRPGVVYKIIRQLFMKVGIALPMYPKFFGAITTWWNELQSKLRRKRLFLYTVLSIGVIARKI